jgi:hypothetical protein
MRIKKFDRNNSEKERIYEGDFLWKRHFLFSIINQKLCDYQDRVVFFKDINLQVLSRNFSPNPLTIKNKQFKKFIVFIFLNFILSYK